MGVLWHSDSKKTPVAADSLDDASLPKRPRRKRYGWRLFWLLLFIGLVALGFAVSSEIHSSMLQAREFSRFSNELGYSMQKGPSNAIAYPGDGPFDKRLGYSALGEFLPRLLKRDYLITQQVRFSPDLLGYSQRGFFVPYQEKIQAGLSITDCRGSLLYQFVYPQQLYPDFTSIPPLVVNSLLFIENRDLLDPKQPRANPAVDWPRFAKAAISQVAKLFALGGQSAGGSTLATQLEKYRHSPDGLTQSGAEKLRQMISASVRAYQTGPQTMDARQRVVRDYLNSVPLSAVPGHGEVHGLAEGLRVWYGADFDVINQQLRASTGDRKSLAERGLALREVLSLVIAQRRPSHYLTRGREELAQLTDSHIRLLAHNGVIDQALAGAALASAVTYRDWAQQPTIQLIETDKGISVARTRLSALLDRPLYDLDRLDLAATSTLQNSLQTSVSQYLQNLADPAFAGKLGLIGDHLLTPTNTAQVRYSFTLFERDPDGSRVRVQTDSTDQPFDINEGSKLELGSTAKMRVLTTYLEIISELHQRYAGQSLSALKKVPVDDSDRLTRWSIDYLIQNKDQNLSTMLAAALDRQYSANPDEGFFTGGGMHHFHNFRNEDNGRSPSLRDALRESINLPFIRLMRDLVRYSIYQSPSSSAQLLKDDDDPHRQEYLSQFADREGTVYLLRFWKRYKGKSTQERLATFLDSIHPTAIRMAAVHRYLLPEANQDTFNAFVRAHLAVGKVSTDTLTDTRLDALYKNYGPGAYNLPDQGFIAKVHPLDLWLVGYLLKHPDAQFKEVVAASEMERQEVYSWLFKSRHKSARDTRIRTMLEIEAFTDIHKRWQRVGYPFDHLVPSLATAIGSSGDRPAALAELIGIIQNDGIRLPVLRIDSLHFAAGTPYETQLISNPDLGKRVLPSEVATAMREALSQVVDAGTAKRVQGSFKLADGSTLAMGGKTGTGDNRLESIGAGGRILGSKSINRTATFVFYIGDNHFGTLTAFVPGRAAEAFKFTSALPVQVLKGMAPILNPYLTPGTRTECQVPAPPLQASTQ
ncbi:transglycosylase domain-containing protein [Pseudomonas sp. CCI3.2]|uniref:transglycosylase domain-containing protein n=1 Tax=unclassified Pseudomonas TaxID=196821 RepID=UPI002AC8C83A|nr:MULTISPECIES: transglycosylase domain-containing protein [unclassified Pseudomonas]MEB0075657.1 transglycosylase domain-containing protein [Pseudomonas sp. MH10out]MEB0093144.1 transglycosylase domain-containing protein [Pseudomonas sp. CCI4.2]MEB0099866.1 transglycosylase domain-containing protein [Pseudomonas sp. CCI3.2]MEB0131068.1 transglycosylase domain-containing protein [Pseudomonas sp. CCI2.4]MEB0160567.1 transglycosylase domain-containing protein [Pseudomonas sp. AH2 (2023)]